MGNIYPHYIARGHKLHDEYLGRLLHTAFMMLLSIVDQATKSTDKTSLTERIKVCRTLHDKKVGLALKSHDKPFRSLHSQRPMSHRVFIAPQRVALLLTLLLLLGLGCFLHSGPVSLGPSLSFYTKDNLQIYCQAPRTQ